MKIKFLGTAANGGVPQVDCRCKNCTTNKIVRKRSCILIEINKKTIIIDCGPDFHSQMIENNIRLQDLSGIIISHLHWDHSSGLVDLSSGKALNIPIFVHKKIRKSLLANNNFNFLFSNKWAKFSKINGVQIELIKVEHDPNFPTFAIKINEGGKSVLIATDIFKLNNKFIREIKKSDLIIFDSTFLNESKHWHLSVAESAPMFRKLNKKVIFTHINHSENPKQIQKFLSNFKFILAFDGMEVKI